MRMDTENNTFYVSNPIGNSSRYPLCNSIEIFLTIHSIKYFKFIIGMILYVKVLKGSIFMKKYDEWNEVKKKIDTQRTIYTKIGEIFFAYLGENIGYEQCGKGENFLRPVVVFKRFGKNAILAIPLTTKPKEGRYYFSFSFKSDKESVALLSQIRFLDTRRLFKKIGRMKSEEYEKLKRKFYEL